MALAGHPVKVYLKATSGSAVAGDEVDGVNDVGYSPNLDMLDVTDFKDTSGAKLKLAGLTDGQVSLSGDGEFGDAPQTLLRTYGPGGASVGASLWATLHFDPAGGALAKGFKVEVKVASYNFKSAVAGKVTFDTSLVFTGAPALE